jgi:hypothetical protein
MESHDTDGGGAKRGAEGGAEGDGRVGSTVVTLASGLGLPFGIGLDSSYVYLTNWETTGDVAKVPRGGGAAITLASGQDRPESIAVQGSNVYWTNSGDVLKVPASGGTIVTMASNQSYPGAIAVTADSIYWANSGAALDDGAVLRMPLAGGGIETLAQAQEIPGAIALSSSRVYWTNLDGLNLVSVSFGGGGPTILVSGGPHGDTTAYEAVATDDTRVYWAENIWTGTKTTSVGQPRGTIMAMPLGGGTPVTLASRQSTPEGLAVYGPYVYWTDLVGLKRVGVAGGETETLAVAAGEETFVGVAVDAKNVYWTSSASNGSILALTFE